jgi:hypothetical protein
VQVDDLVPYIIQAQDLYLQTSLGTKFYNRLKDGVIAGNLTQIEKDLINDYIAQMLLNYSMYLAMPSLKYKFTNASIVSPTSETAATITLEELKYLRQCSLDTAEFYDQRLRTHLKQHPEHYVEYWNPGVYDMQPSRQTPYSSGLVIPKYINKKYDETTNTGPWQCDECFGDEQTWG